MWSACASVASRLYCLRRLPPNIMPSLPFHFVPLPLVFRALLLLVAVVAGIYDWKYRRIPNWLTLAGLIAGFSCHCYLGGWAGLLVAAEGFGLGGGIYFVLYMLRGMGAGDVKLMAALGSIAGPMSWFILFLATSILGGVVAVCMTLAYGRFYSTLWNVAQIVKELALFRAPYKQQPQLDLHHKAALRAPHGTIIAATAVLLVIARWL
jgi:prepilin peptidase CpaA